MNNHRIIICIRMIFIFAHLMSMHIFSATPFAYIKNEGNETVSFIDIATDIVIDTIPVGGGSIGVAVIS